MSNIYKLTNTKGEIRRVRSMTQFHVQGHVYYDLDGFHFLNDSSNRLPRDSWDYEGYARNAAERFVLESYRVPVLVVDETQGDLFVGIYPGRDEAWLESADAAVLAEWRKLEESHRNLEKARQLKKPRR